MLKLEFFETVWVIAMFFCKTSHLFASDVLKTVISNFVVGRGDVAGTDMGTLQEKLKIC